MIKGWLDTVPGVADSYWEANGFPGGMILPAGLWSCTMNATGGGGPQMGWLQLIGEAGEQLILPSAPESHSPVRIDAPFKAVNAFIGMATAPGLVDINVLILRLVK